MGAGVIAKVNRSGKGRGKIAPFFISTRARERAQNVFYKVHFGILSTRRGYDNIIRVSGKLFLKS